MTERSPAYSYSAVADSQLDALESGADSRLYNLVVDLCEEILESPHLVRERSAALMTDEGIRFRTPVLGSYPYKVFWSLGDSGPRIEAVFPYPT